MTSAFPIFFVTLVIGLATAAQEPVAPKLTRPPKVKKFVQPQYPEAARAAARTATVTLTLDVSAEGKVTAAVPTSAPKTPNERVIKIVEIIFAFILLLLQDNLRFAAAFIYSAETEKPVSWALDCSIPNERITMQFFIQR